MICRNCQKEFEPEAFEVFCGPDCTSAGNRKRQYAGVGMAAYDGIPGSVLNDCGPCDGPESEEEFQARVIELAKSLGWKHYHTRDSRKSVAGYPDLTLWRDRVIFVELKAANGTVSAAQSTVHEDMLAAGAELYVWRPADWSTIVEVLTRRDASA